MQILPTLEEVIKAFDLNVSKFGFSVHENWRFAKKCEWNYLFNKRLEWRENYDFKNEGIGLLQRICKYNAKGFKLSPRKVAELYATIATVNSPKKYKKEFAKQKEKIVDSYDFLDEGIKSKGFTNKNKTWKSIFYKLFIFTLKKLI